MIGMTRDHAVGGGVREAGRDYLDALDAYAAASTAAGSTFVEIQHTTLFAATGQRGE